MIVSLALLAISAESLAELKEFKFQTAADGEVSYMVDTATKLPIGASDDRATVTDGALTLHLRKGQAYWTWKYALAFKTDGKVSSVRIEDESAKQLELLLRDENPQLQNKSWAGTEPENLFTPAEFDRFAARGNWFLQRRITVIYEDGVKSTLHQLIVETQPMRVELIDKAMLR